MKVPRSLDFEVNVLPAPRSGLEQGFPCIFYNRSKAQKSLCVPAPLSIIDKTDDRLRGSKSDMSELNIAQM